jgi:methyl acetate hydrolase
LRRDERRDQWASTDRKSTDWAGIFKSYFWIDRAAGVGGVFMTQILPFFDAGVVELLEAFEFATYAQVGAAVLR